MKTTLLLLLASWACLLAILPLPARAQNYSLDWFTIDGGGGTSTGGVYTISGTIGQPDAGTMTGGNYSLIGGFWAVAVAVQTEGAPLLTIKTVGTSVIVSWPSSSTGFSLLENPSLGTDNWTLVTQPVQDDGTTKSVTLPLSPGSRFYRLRK
jgi:hypothetical protein